MKNRKAAECGHAEQGWLDTYHTFGFANYCDPQWMGSDEIELALSVAGASAR